MDPILMIYGLLILVATVLASITIWAPRRLGVKICAVALASAFMPLTYTGLVELLSKPKPTALEWPMRDLTEADVIASTLKEGEAIYLWLQLTDIEEPRAYRLPWDDKLARELYEAQQQSEKEGGALRMRRPFEPSLDESQPMFYAAPQAANPPKVPPEESPITLRRDDDA